MDQNKKKEKKEVDVQLKMVQKGGQNGYFGSKSSTK